MAHGRSGKPIPSLTEIDRHRVTRRALLRALGFGAAAIAGRQIPVRNGAAAAQDMTAGSRAAGGPDLDQALWEMAYDPEQIFRFVAEEISYEAYGGALRGAKGTHWSLAGNSVDQALLLAEMLTRAQVRVRFAVGELADDAAETLLAEMRLDETGARMRAERVGAGAQANLDRYRGLTDEQRTALQSPEELRERLLARARAQLVDGLNTVEAALTSESIAPPVPAPALPERERTQHVWVQYGAGSQWIDLDPSFPNAEAGRAYATLNETWDVVPDDLYHRVRFRVVVEKNAGGTAVREDSLVYDARAADLVGVPVVFAHVEPNAIKGLGVSIGGLVDGTRQYIPTLLAGSAGELGVPVTLGAGGGVLDVLGSGDADGEAMGEAIGEWLEIDILPADEPPRRIVREVFDRVGVDRRAAGAVDLASLPPVELLDDPQLGSVFLPLEAVWLIGVVGGMIPGSYFDQEYAIDDVQADMALLVHGYHGARDALQAEIAAAHGYRWYHNEPNLTAAVLAPVRIEPAQINLTASLDLLHQGYGVVPIEGMSPTVHPRVLAGVFAHVAERVGADVAADLTPESPPPAGSVAEVFAEAARSGVAIRTLMPDTADLSSLAVSDVARARIAEALRAGYVVVVPERAVTLGGREQTGWWQIEPGTGRTFDLMENGRGASPMGENTVIIVGGPAWRAATAWKILSFAIGVIVGFSVAMAISMYPN